MAYEQNGVWYGDDGRAHGSRETAEADDAARARVAGTDWGAVEERLRQEAAQRGLDYSPTDLQDIQRNYGYDVATGSLDQLIRNATTKYDERSVNVPGDGDGGGGGGGGGSQGYPRDGGAAITQEQINQLLSAIESMNSQPGVDLSNIQPGDFPIFEVPGEFLSPAIDDTLLDLMEGYDPFDMQGRIQALLDETEGGGINSARLQNRLEAARENLTRGQMATLSDMRAVLADRGLLSTPGSPEGSEAGETSRLLEPLQRAYLGEVRQAEFDESKAAEGARLDALSRATGWTESQINSRLGAARTAQERQQMMSDIALGVLDRNIAWNKFLAEFGLEREKVAEDIRRGRIDAVAPILQLFTLLISQSRGGHI